MAITAKSNPWALVVRVPDRPALVVEPRDLRPAMDAAGADPDARRRAGRAALETLLRDYLGEDLYGTHVRACDVDLPEGRPIALMLMS